MEARIKEIREVPELPVETMGDGVYLVADDGIEYIVDPFGGCSCGGGRRVATCEHIEAAQAADVGACGVDRGALAYHQYLALDSALRRLVEPP